MKNYFVQLHQLLFNKGKRKDVLLNIAGEKFNVKFFFSIFILICILSTLMSFLIRQDKFKFLFENKDILNTYISFWGLYFECFFGLFIFNSFIFSLMIYKLKITFFKLFNIFNIYMYLFIPFCFINILSILFMTLPNKLDFLNILGFIMFICSLFLFYIINLWAIYLLKDNKNLKYIFFKYIFIIVSIIFILLITFYFIFIYVLMTGTTHI